MYYDLLINDRENFYVYGRIDTFSEVISLCEKSLKDYFQTVYVRKVSSYGADCWKYLSKKSCSYSKLYYVDVDTNDLICSKFKEKMKDKICRIASQKNQLI